MGETDSFGFDAGDRSTWGDPDWLPESGSPRFDVSDPESRAEQTALGSVGLSETARLEDLLPEDYSSDLDYAHS